MSASYFPGIYFAREYWDFAVDVTDQIDARKKAEAMYKSQGHDEEYAARRVEISVGHQGMSSGVPYAEGFVQESAPTVPHIELSAVHASQGDGDAGGYDAVDCWERGRGWLIIFLMSCFPRERPAQSRRRANARSSMHAEGMYSS